MGVLSLLLGADNPVAKYATQNHNLLSQWGVGLAAGPTFSAGLSKAAQMGPQGQALDDANAASIKAEQKRQEQLNQTTQFLQAKFPDLGAALASGAPLPEVWGEAMKRMGPQGQSGSDPANVAEYKFYSGQEQQAGRQPLSFEDWRKGSSKAPRAGLGQPVPLKNRKSGEYVPFEPMSDGSMINTLTGEPANGTDWMFDPGMIASDKSAGSAYGTAQGGAQFNLDTAKQNVEQELGNIAALKTDTAGIEETFGKLGGVIPQQWTPTLPGTKRADYATRLDQVKGQNFLQAYSTLRGAGAITEAEGAKAQDAMGRLSGAQSKEAYLQALTDLETVLKNGYDRMATQASKGPYQSSGFTPAPIGDGATADDLVTKYLGQ